MFRTWLLMASVVCGFLAVGCGKKETPIAADSPPPATSGPGASGGSSEMESMESNSAGGAVPPGGSSSEEGSSNGGGYPGGSEMGYAGGPGSFGGANGEEDGMGGYPGGQPGMGGYPGGQSGFAGSQMGGNNSGQPRRNLPPPKPKKLTAKERATVAFEAGNMTRAYSLYHAFAISGDDARASEIADEMRWAARRPQIGLKVAVGLAMKNPANVPTGSLKPIGTDRQSILGALAGGAGGGGPGEGGPGSGGLGGMPGGGDEMGFASGGAGFNGMEPSAGTSIKGVRAKALADAAGLLAEKVVDAFRDELSSGAFTVAFKEYPMSSRPGASFLKGYAPTGTQGMGGGMGYPGGDGMGYPGGDGMGDFGGFNGAPGGMGADGGGGAPGPQGGMIPGRQFFFSPQTGQAGMDSIGIDGPSTAGVPGAGGPGLGRGGPGVPPGQPSFGSSDEMPGAGQGGQGGQMFGQGEGYPGGDGQGFQGQNQLPPPPNISKDIRRLDGVTPLAACLHYIGANEQSKLIKKAYEEGYDALLVFEVDIVQNRQTQVVNNTARVKAIIPAETQKEAKIVFSSSPLVNITVANAKAKNQNDGVEDAANRVIKKLVEAIALKDIPESLKPEAVVANRIPKLLTEEGLSKLEKLGEINFYYSKGFIDESQRDDFFSKIAGKFAGQWMTGSDEEKEEAIDELLGD